MSVLISAIFVLTVVSMSHGRAALTETGIVPEAGREFIAWPPYAGRGALRANVFPIIERSPGIFVRARTIGGIVSPEGVGVGGLAREIPLTRTVVPVTNSGSLGKQYSNNDGVSNGYNEYNFPLNGGGGSFYPYYYGSVVGYGYQPQYTPQYF